MDYNEQEAFFIIGLVLYSKHYSHLFIEALLEETLAMTTNSVATFTITPSSFRYKRIRDYIYDTHAVLGTGNFSTVYRAERDTTSKLYAIKVVKLASLGFQKLQELLEQQIAIVRILNHVNVIRCYEVLKSNNHCYFVTELCEDGTLQKTLKGRGEMEEEKVWVWVNQIYQGLKYISKLKIIHRDIKPANIFIKDGILKIADFGFAVRSNHSFKDLTIGSPVYMSPEGYLRNQYGPKTDVWAFGVVIYEMVHGHTPLLSCGLEAKISQKLSRNISQGHFRKDISWQLKDFIRRCLEVNIQKRISFQEVQLTPYFQKYQTNFTRPQIITMTKQQRLSVPLIEHLSTIVSSFKIGSGKQNIKSVDFQVLKVNKGNKKHMQQEYIETQKNMSVLIQEQRLLNGQITMNQAIGLVHFCRIGFRLAQKNLRDTISGLPSNIKSFIILVLTQLLSITKKSLIKYDQPQTRIIKQAKLNFVLQEYLFKYEEYIKCAAVGIPLKILANRLQDRLAEEEEKPIREIEKCYLLMIFTYFTLKLSTTPEETCLKVFGESGNIDTCLQERNIPKTEKEYELKRNKYFGTAI